MATTCTKCGAVIDPLALSCPYCGLTTPAGVAAHERAKVDAEARAAWHAHAEQLAQALARQAAQKTANSALLWSLAGTVLCCLPLGAVGVVQGLRARAAAGRARVNAPGKAVAGLVLGILSMVMSVSFVTWAVIRDQAESKESKERIQALLGTTTAGAARPELEHDVACGLAEIYARREGMKGHRGHTLVAFECHGALLPLGPDKARLDDFRFRPSTGDDKPPFEVGVCFKRGAVWYVTKMGDGACDDAPAP